MPTPDEEQLQLRIRELEKEVVRLHAQIKQQRYGLTWIDVPEAFDEKSENSIPILEEVPELSFKTDDGKPTHILIEGDNYHALTCLNYTHRGKVDVIYIDPPYNTGNDGFIYKDKRMLDRYPDGSEIKTNNPLRHSAWLSFMNKRLVMAKELLSKDGVIFISIDENELGQLKLLCDEIFNSKNFEGCITWESTTQPINAGSARFQLQKKTETILCYSKDRSTRTDFILKIDESVSPVYPHIGKLGKCRFEIIEKSDAGLYRRDTMKFQILGQYPRKGKRWQIGKETAFLLEKTNRLEIIDGIVKRAIYPEDELDKVKYIPFWSHYAACKVGSALSAKEDLNEIMGHNIGFDTVKPIKLIAEFISHFRKSAIILDFFAGSGTTLHATMNLNEEDGGQRQCILVQLNEADICRNVTYERNRRVMQGYTDAKGNEVKGLGNSLKYYRTDFAGENDAKHANEQDRIQLAHKAGCLLALAENTLDETMRTTHYQLFTDGRRLTAVYFQEDLSLFDEFVERVRTAAMPTSVYVFCWGSADEFQYNFEGIPAVSLKSIPEPILKIYQTLNA